MIYGHGGDIYTYQDMLDFSVNVNPLGPPQCVIEAAKRGVEQMAVYPDIRCTGLRKKLAYRQGLPEEYYIFGNGAAELIYTLTLARKPKHALIPVPAFSEYEQALRSVGCDIKYHRTKQEDYFCIHQDFLEELKEDVDIVFLCSPSNPSGHVIDRGLLHEVVNRCERLGILLVLDECFIEFLHTSKEKTMVRETENYRHLFVLRAFTKTYAMPGLRLGYGITSDKELLEKMLRKRQPWSVSVPAQEAGMAALDAVDYVQTARECITRERQYLEKKFRELNIGFIPSDANFILMYTEKDLFEEMRKYRILIRDCGNYRGLQKGWYRVAVRTRQENMLLIKALQDIMGKVEETR